MCLVVWVAVFVVTCFRLFVCFRVCLLVWVSLSLSVFVLVCVCCCRYLSGVYLLGGLCVVCVFYVIACFLFASRVSCSSASCACLLFLFAFFVMSLRTPLFV